MYWNCYDGEYSHSAKSDKHTFVDVEKNFYTENFSQSVTAQNERHIASRHNERIKEVTDLLKDQKTCPEEELLYIGNKDFMENTPNSRKQLWDICMDYVQKMEAKYPNLKYMDVSLHCDEKGAIHAHARRVWIGHDKDGFQCVNQGKALNEMGIERPDMSKPKTRNNNPKQTFTKESRELFKGLCRDRGIEFSDIPLDATETGLSHELYKTQQEIATREDRINDHLAVLRQDIKDNADLRDQQLHEIETNQITLDDQKSVIQDNEDRLQRQETAISTNKSVISGQKEKFDTAKQEHDKLVADNKKLQAQNKTLVQKNNDLAVENKLLQRLEKSSKTCKKPTVKNSTLHKDALIVSGVTEKQVNDAFVALENSKILRSEQAKFDKDKSAFKKKVLTVEEQEQAIQNKLSEILDQSFHEPFSIESGNLKTFCEKTKLTDGRTIYQAFKEEQDLIRKQAIELSRHVNLGGPSL